MGTPRLTPAGSSGLDVVASPPWLLLLLLLVGLPVSLDAPLLQGPPELLRRLLPPSPASPSERPALQAGSRGPPQICGPRGQAGGRLSGLGGSVDRC